VCSWLQERRGHKFGHGLIHTNVVAKSLRLRFVVVVAEKIIDMT
jgi:hypothetical protein